MGGSANHGPRAMKTGESSNEDHDHRVSNWSRHWAGGVTHSCAGSFGADYGGAIATFWNEVFASLAPGSRVLDIATGNGALPRLLLQSRPMADWSCDAIDLAHVAPARWPTGDQPASVRFHAGVMAERLPFADRSFDLIVSQYGLEYSRLEDSVAEMRRVCTPGGRIALVVHHADSRPVTLAATEIAHIDWLLSPEGLLGTAAPLLEPLSRASSAAGRESLARDAHAEAVRERFNAAQDLLAQRCRTPEGADVLIETQSRLAEVVQVALSARLAAATDALASLASALTDARWRLVDLQRHAMSAAEIEWLCRQLQEATGATTNGPVIERGYLMGWGIRAGF